MSNFIENFEAQLMKNNLVHVQQVWEGFEIVLGWETRNKYRILDEDGGALAFAAEQSSGFFGTILRQLVGHWRSFRIFIFNQNKEKMYELHFPFRWFFKTLYVTNAHGKKIGHLEERFAIFRKKFDVYDSRGRVIARINSSFFKFWTFEFKLGPQDLGVIRKKWSGALGEFFTDKDNFIIGIVDDKKSDTSCICL